MKILGRFLLNLTIYVAIVAGILFGLPRLLAWQLGTPYPMAAITSGSMWPELKRGDLILIKHVPEEEIEMGDIIVWQNADGFTIHRVVELRDKTVITKGDANFAADAPVAYADVVGRMVKLGTKPFRIPYLGLLSVAGGKYLND